MLRGGNGVRIGTLGTLSGSESGGPLYWANAERSSPGSATVRTKGLTVHDYLVSHSGVSRAIRARICSNRARGTATSAIWNVT